MEQIPTLTSNLDEEKPLKTINLETESKSKEKYIINIIGYHSYMNIKIKSLNKEFNKEYEEKYSLDDIKKISKYFSICESITEVICSIEPNIKQSNIIEDKNIIKLIISLNHPLCKEAIFEIKEKIKIFSSSELYYMISELRANNKNQQNIINNQQEIINDLMKKINQLNEKQEEMIKDFQNKINDLIKRVNILENKIKEKEENEILNKKEIKNKEEKIKILEEELNKYKPININNNINDNTYNNFDIKFKKPIHILNYHKKRILCSTILKDGRFATGSDDGSIIIYNNQTFEPDIIIRDHFGEVYCILQLSSGILASCSKDKTIKLFSINKYEYNVIQTIKIFKDIKYDYERYYIVKEIIELKNKNLIFYSPGEIYFFYKDNNEYKIDYSFAIYICANVFKSIIQTKDNEICYNDKRNLCFYDLIQRKIITKIDDIATIDEKIITKICTKIGVFANKDKINQCLMCAGGAEDKIDYAAHLDSLIMMTKDLLLVAVKNKLKIINVKLYNLIRIIDVPGSGTINCICMLNDNMLLTADLYGRIIQWKIEGDNLKLFSRKELAHEDSINTLLKIGNGLILSGGKDVRIW